MPVTPLAPLLPHATSVVASPSGGQNNPLRGGSAGPVAEGAQRTLLAIEATNVQEPAATEVSLSAEASAAQQPAAEQAPVLAPIYAEIWRDGQRIAQVDIHGQVSSSAGVIATAGSGIAGPLLAAQRAVQTARQLGGEIRIAGQALDSQTVLMRERLANAYNF